MSKELLTMDPNQYGWCLETFTGMWRGEKISGLTCLSNSAAESPLLSSQFKDLNLQLHASSSVANPYTFNIQGNTYFSTIKDVEPPDETTVLASGESTNGYVERTFTIPDGVNIVYVVGNAFAWCHHVEYEETSNTIGSTNKVYKSGSDEISAYVKVTPGKTYTMYAAGDTSSFSIVDPGTSEIKTSLTVYCSKAINDKAPQVEDL